MNEELRIKYDLDRRFWVKNLLRWAKPIWHDDIIQAILSAKEANQTVFMLTVGTPRTYDHEGDSGLFIVRPLTRLEAETIIRFNELNISFDRDLITGRAVLWPGPDIQPNLLAGMVESVYDIIEDVSGWGNMEKLQIIQAEKRTELGVGADFADVSSQIDMMSSTVFKAIHPMEVQNYDAYQSMKITSMIEKVLEEQEFKFDLTPPVDRSEELEKRRQRFRVKHGNGRL